ncbi:PREDICTED: protein XRI1-like [Nelumbo nucifera]|uniref:Protein XRI1-like n=2 Tax=Nelumbo nucifera TaxID=4432 RepID=A0A1U8BHZ1_NELNU|nr:PREDICTED: protein XRI1-like [Nelumbo nucifera]DAD32418.1 TPA_asm: hypothetical protein HUJ06_011269 [Nelumbo nucifera]
MAYNSSLLCPHPSLAWDLNNVGVFNADMSLVMESTAPFFLSPADFSTGYLQDALVEWGDRCKQRRLQFYDSDQTAGFDHFVQNFSNSNCTKDPPENFHCLSQISDSHGISDELLNSSISSISDEETVVFSELKTPEETVVSAPETHNTSASSYKNPLKTSSICDKDTLLTRDPLSSSEGRCQKKNKVITGVVYPFALVKPGGEVDGTITLNDINERILMPPTRPVRHPVGDFACRPCVCRNGLGLSGKSVVALTRIHTQGRGTITIIRTRG